MVWGSTLYAMGRKYTKWKWLFRRSFSTCCAREVIVSKPSSKWNTLWQILPLAICRVGQKNLPHFTFRKNRQEKLLWKFYHILNNATWLPFCADCFLKITSSRWPPWTAIHRCKRILKFSIALGVISCGISFIVLQMAAFSPSMVVGRSLNTSLLT